MSTDDDGTFEPEVPDPGEAAERVAFDATSGDDLVADLPSGSEIPGDLARTFWSTVLLANVALLAASLGVLLGLFRGWSLVAALLVVVGVVAGLRTVRRVRAYEGA